MLEALRWLFSPAWDAVELTLKIGFICPFVVIDSNAFSATIFVAEALCLIILNLSPTQQPAFLPKVMKATVWA